LNVVSAPTYVNAGIDLCSRLRQARKRSDELFAIVKPESIYDRPIPERHRIVFYVGHLEAFDWNLLHDRILHLKPFQPEFDRLFAFGIDPVGGGLPDDQPKDWPSFDQVNDYVHRVRRALDDGIESVLQSAGAATETSQLLSVAIEHRLMHAETLAYMLHQLPLPSKISSPATRSSWELSAHNEAIRIPSGTATLGLSRRDPEAFGWDNEFDEHTLTVPEFSIDKYKVTNRQFLEFLDSGGYDDRTFWNDADWAWRTEQNISHPAFWKKHGGRWLQRTMFEEVPLPLDWPVYVSQAEAAAYARWAGKSLPTEAQWHRAAHATPEGGERSYPWGQESPDSAHGNFDFQSWDPAPVASSPAGASGFGVSGLLGNGWEWTSTVFAPFAGFEAFSFYPGYSANFFDGKHYVLKGGSARTAACMLRRSFRNWFQPHYQYVYAGFRCVTS
jgi:iron(II)-dependent oxidoreductase